MRIACNITSKKRRSLKNANRCVLFLLEAIIWFGASTDTKYNKAVCLNFNAFEYRGGGFVCPETVCINTHLLAGRRNKHERDNLKWFVVVVVFFIVVIDR